MFLERIDVIGVGRVERGVFEESASGVSFWRGGAGGKFGSMVQREIWIYGTEGKIWIEGTRGEFLDRWYKRGVFGSTVQGENLDRRYRGKKGRVGINGKIWRVGINGKIWRVGINGKKGRVGINGKKGRGGTNGKMGESV